MSYVDVHVVVASGPVEDILQFKWNESAYPALANEYTPRGLLRMDERDDGTARAVWFSTLENYVVLPAGLTYEEPTEQEVEVAKERVALFWVLAAVNRGNYKKVANIFLSKHKRARHEPTEFDAICAAAAAEIESQQLHRERFEA